MYQGLLAAGETDGQDIKIHLIAGHHSAMACRSTKQKPVLKGLVNKGDRTGAGAPRELLCACEAECFCRHPI